MAVIILVLMLFALLHNVPETCGVTDVLSSVGGGGDLGSVGGGPLHGCVDLLRVWDLVALLVDDERLAAQIDSSAIVKTLLICK